MERLDDAPLGRSKTRGRGIRRPDPRSRELQARVIEAAVALLNDGGETALTTRALAERAGTTTMTLYSRFGGMTGVLAAVLEQGFAMLRDRLQAVVPTDDPLRDFDAICAVYRDFAFTSPALYEVMFETDVTGFIAQAGSSPGEAFEVLRGQVARCLPSAARQDVDLAAFSAWALCHGLVCIERSGIGRTLRPVDAQEAYRLALRRNLEGARPS